MSTLKDLAQQAQAAKAGTATPAEAATQAQATTEAPAAATQATTEAPEATAAATEETKKTVAEAVGAKPKAKPKRKAPKVDDEWVEKLTAKAQEKYGKADEFGKADISFTVAKSKGRFVSLTPKLVYSDGTIKSAGAKNRIGFCTNGDWDTWFEKLHKALTAAHTSEKKASTGRRSGKSQWTAFSVAVKEALEGKEVQISSSGKRFRVKADDGSVTLRREEDKAIVSNAGGSMEFVKTVLSSVSELTFAEAA